MPSNDISSPTVAAPVDRMSLGVDSVRRIATGVGDNAIPSGACGRSTNPMWGVCVCFENSIDD